MRCYQFEEFGIDALQLVERDTPEPGPGEIRLDLKALSLNFRDYMVVKGAYNPRLPTPATPISDGAGVVSAVGPDVTRVKVGDEVVSHFVSGWIDGPFQAEYGKTTLGTPQTGLAAEQAILPAEAVLPLPKAYSFEQAATLPIAALTAWSVLFTEGNLQPGQSILTLGTGGVSIFALQFAKAMGATVIITSSSDQKLQRARQLGADHTINYRAIQNWEQEVVHLTAGRGVDITVETGGAATLDQSMVATRAAGTIGVLGALTGIKAEVTTGLILMKRLHLAGILVDSRAAFEDMIRFIQKHEIKPVIDQTFPFNELPQAFDCMAEARHFGKIVITL